MALTMSTFMVISIERYIYLLCTSLGTVHHWVGLTSFLHAIGKWKIFLGIYVIQAMPLLLLLYSHYKFNYLQRNSTTGEEDRSSTAIGAKRG